MGYGTFYAIRRLSSVLFVGVLILGATIGRADTAATFIISVGLVLLGTPAFIYGISAADRYKNTYDYEPTLFWGKPTNGKHAREVLITFSSVGLWCALTGLALALITR